MSTDITNVISNLILTKSVTRLNVEMEVIKNILISHKVCTKDELENHINNYMEVSGSNELIKSIDTEIEKYRKIQSLINEKMEGNTNGKEE